LNPGPHGPELWANSSRTARNSRFQFESSGAPPTCVQICGVLQADYYMNCYRLDDPGRRIARHCWTRPRSTPTESTHIYRPPLRAHTYTDARETPPYSCGFEDRVSNVRQGPATSAQDEKSTPTIRRRTPTVANVRRNGCQLDCQGYSRRSSRLGPRFCNRRRPRIGGNPYIRSAAP